MLCASLAVLTVSLVLKLYAVLVATVGDMGVVQARRRRSVGLSGEDTRAEALDHSTQQRDSAAAVVANDCVGGSEIAATQSARGMGDRTWWARRCRAALT